MKRFSAKRFFALLCAAALVFSLTACGDSGLNSFTWFVESIPTNLDPQVATASEDVIACTNLYTGLLRKDADGQLIPACCERYEVSADGLQYTFYLKRDLPYLGRRGAHSGQTVTAQDFVFAFRRIYTAATNSPYANTYAAIQNSTAVLQGRAGPEQLGVTAPDDVTLVFTLDRADPSFLEKLTLPGAAPCNEAFFESTSGTYGLSSAAILTNGSFYLQNWTAGGLFLRRAAEGDAINNLRLVQNTNHTGLPAAQLISEAYCSAALDDGNGDAAGMNAVAYTDTTWCLLFNHRTPALANQSMRRALAGAALQAQLPLDGGNGFFAAEGLIPAGVTVDGLDYRTAAGSILPVFEPNDPKAALLAARESLPDLAGAGLTLLVPEGSEIAALAQTLNASWQKQLSLFFSIETVPQSELEQRLAAGQFTLALAPLQMTQNDPLDLLSRFTAGGFTGYRDAAYDALCHQAGTDRAAQYAAAERKLVQEECAVLPLFHQQHRLLTARDITGLRFDPYGPVLDLTDARRLTKN